MNEKLNVFLQKLFIGDAGKKMLQFKVVAYETAVQISFIDMVWIIRGN